VIPGEDKITFRKADVEECFLGGWPSPEAAMEFAVKNSTMSFKYVVNGEVLCCWGFAAESILCSNAKAWMLSTPAIEKYRVHAARASRQLLSTLLEDFYSVTVLVDPTYDLAVRWLEWLGFSKSRDFDRYIEMRVTRGSRA
jgi:hypothetical protein